MKPHTLCVVVLSPERNLSPTSLTDILKLRDISWDIYLLRYIWKNMLFQISSKVTCLLLNILAIFQAKILVIARTNTMEFCLCLSTKSCEVCIHHHFVFFVIPLRPCPSKKKKKKSLLRPNQWITWNENPLNLRGNLIMVINHLPVIQT